MLAEGAGTIKATLVPHLDAHQGPQEGNPPRTACRATRRKLRARCPPAHPRADNRGAKGRKCREKRPNLERRSR
jgi:hypothetical protein